MPTRRCLDLESMRVTSPVGDILLEACGRGLHCVSQSSDRREATFECNPSQVVVILSGEDATSPTLKQAFEWLKHYFLDVPQLGSLRLPSFCTQNHSEFMTSVWEELAKTKPGETLSYADLSFRTLGHRRASRAVGSAMKTNPYQFMVPCHRVVKSSGELGSYYGGVGLKEWLISHEKLLTRV